MAENRCGEPESGAVKNFEGLSVQPHAGAAAVVEGEPGARVLDQRTRPVGCGRRDSAPRRAAHEVSGQPVDRHDGKQIEVQGPRPCSWVSGGETPDRSAEAESLPHTSPLRRISAHFVILSAFPCCRCIVSFLILCLRASALIDRPSPSQLAARDQLAAARQALRDRKRDTRRKIVAGAALLAAAADDPAVCQVVRRVLQARVTRPVDRAVIADLLDG